jgi:predicted N-formylglutamate amidohydrolase
LSQRGSDLVNGSRPLLSLNDPNPVIVENPGGASPLLLAGDHAGRIIPQALQGLGVGQADMARHIAWDIGVAGLGALLARRCDATFIRQAYSRLVIDCNRDPSHPGAMPAVSDGTAIPGNAALSAEDRAARVTAIFKPYHDRIAAELDRRRAAGQPTVFVALHSFTPSMNGFDRPWRFGVLHRGDSAFSRAMLAALRARYGDEAGENQPYAMDGTDYTVPHHVDPRGLDYLELEVRQDLIETPEQQNAVMESLAEVLEEALAHCS